MPNNVLVRRLVLIMNTLYPIALSARSFFGDFAPTLISAAGVSVRCNFPVFGPVGFRRTELPIAKCSPYAKIYNDK